jgi:hypothetical protein
MRAVVTVLLVSFALATGIAIAPSASAAELDSTPTSTNTLVLGDCAATVSGTPGASITLSPQAVLTPVLNVVHSIDPLNVLTPIVSGVVSTLPNIPLGSVPTNGAAQRVISGGQIADAVSVQLGKIPVLGPVLATVVSGVQQTLGATCSIVVNVVNVLSTTTKTLTSSIPALPIPTSTQPPAASNPPTSNPPVSTPTPPKSTPSPAKTTPKAPVVATAMPTPTKNSGQTAVQGSAGNIVPSGGVLAGSNVSGYAPQYSILDASQSQAASAGNAQAITPVSHNTVLGLPLLLTILALAGVVAGLVRTWSVRNAKR